MPHINVIKSYNQVPLRDAKVPAGFNMPGDWLNQLGNLAADILHLDAAAKASLLSNLNRHAGPGSTYSLKTQLHESLQVMYAVVLTNPAAAADQKSAFAAKLVEGAPQCTAGFHDRTNELVHGLSMPENFDGLLGMVRHDLVKKAAAQTTDEVHAHNRFFVMAVSMGYGVRPPHIHDAYAGAVADRDIENKLKDVFARDFTFIKVLTMLHEQLLSLVRTRGYNGHREAGYAYDDYKKFDNDFIAPFIKMPFDVLFTCEDDENFVPIVKDINWDNVKRTLYKAVIDNAYFILSEDEKQLLTAILEESVSFNNVPPTAMSFFQSSMPDGTTHSPSNALMDTLTFFSFMPVSKKADLILYYLKNTPAAQHRVLLESIEKIPALYTGLLSNPHLRDSYLSKALSEKNLDKIKILVSRGADINPHLDVLARKDKSFLIQWLANDSALQAMINDNGMKTIAVLMIQSKKGRQLLLANEKLRNLCPANLAGKPLKEWMDLAQKEKYTLPNGLFTPVNPLVKLFLQHVINGEQAQAEKMLKDHFRALTSLLTTKETVKDYSGRKIKGTALQLALGAEDVKYHPGEECMVEMIHKYLRMLPDGRAIIAEQTTEQFPEGWESVEQARVQRDIQALRKVFDAIAESKDGDDCDAAIQTFRNYLYQENKGRGVITTGKHFNHELLHKAYELYDANQFKFRDQNNRKNNLAWRKVIGGIQRHLPAATAQAICQDPYSVFDDKLERSLRLRHTHDHHPYYYPLDQNPTFRLGEDYAIMLRHCSSSRVTENNDFLYQDTKTYYKLCRTKNITHAAYIRECQSLQRLQRQARDPEEASGGRVMCWDPSGTPW